jgi:hypothetical protein
MFYALVRSLTVCGNYGFNLVRLLVINLILFCIFFLLYLSLLSNCAVPVYLCIVALECSLSKCPFAAKPACQ